MLRVKSEGWRVRGVIEGGSVKSDGGRGREKEEEGGRELLTLPIR